MDNIILSNYISPGLTTVDFKKEKMGSAAVDLLLQLSDGTKPAAKKIVFNGEVVHRRSVRNISMN
jgi:DNA-binding LacI/PurR family transcriptional regulator